MRSKHLLILALLFSSFSFKLCSKLSTVPRHVLLIVFGLETRLQLYHEIQDGNLPKDLVQRYKGTPLTLLRIVRQTVLIYHLLFNNFSFLKFPKNKSK